MLSSDSHRHKRTFEEMSHQSTLSPSPVHNFAGFATSIFPRNTPPDMPDQRRRRSQHPHNPPRFSPSASQLPNIISGRNLHSSRPSLQRQESRTLTIDLTNEPEDEPTRTMESNRRRERPPQLGRSDGESLAIGDIIDLTADNDDNEVQITSSRRRENPLASQYASAPQNGRPRRDAGLARAASPGLFMPAAPQREIHRVFGNNGPVVPFRGGYQLRMPEMTAAAYFNPDNGGQLAVHFGQWIGAPQAMPVNLDYQRHAFEERKPDHVPPPLPKAGFTRSPTEGDVVICPSCDEELVHHKSANEEVVVKKGGRAPTRKEREEHPFWVLKDCGHVYCNSCYQNRSVKGATSRSTSFRAIPGKTKKACAVEDCQTEVTDKNKWVGVFL